MALLRFGGAGRGLTARVGWLASVLAVTLVLIGGGYHWTLSRLDEVQRDAARVAAYGDVVSSLRDSYHSFSAAMGDASRDVERRAWVAEWLGKLRHARTSLDSLQLGNQQSPVSAIELERALHAFAAHGGASEFNAVETELDVVRDQIGQLRVSDELASRDLIARARWFGLLTLGLTLAAVVLGARRWAKKSIVEPLTTICDELERTTKETANSGSQLDASANRVLAASTIQAEAIQETVAAMNEITAMVAQTTSRAGTSATEARAVLEKTRAGKAVISEMNEAMQSLTQANEKLERISKIFKQISHKTTVINDIAFKTKMLSINAAVEAARAGQHGRGFSVVASEVGNLSKLSADAANAVRALLASSQQEVSDIIETTSAQVRAGSRVTSAVDQAFSEIAKAVQQVAEQAAAISQAANEQELGVKQTASGIEQIHSKMLETRGVAEDTRAELGAMHQSSSRLAALSLGLRQVLEGSGQLAETNVPGRPTSSSEGSDDAASDAVIDDVEAAALVKRLGSVARDGRDNLGVANDNTAKGRAVS